MQRRSGLQPSRLLDASPAILPANPLNQCARRQLRSANSCDCSENAVKLMLLPARPLLGQLPHTTFPTAGNCVGKDRHCIWDRADSRTIPRQDESHRSKPSPCSNCARPGGKRTPHSSCPPGSRRTPRELSDLIELTVGSHRVHPRARRELGPTNRCPIDMT